MSSRRGMTLLLVLVMSAFIGISAMLLFSTTNMEMMSPKTSYEVKVHFSPRLSAGQYVVESVGYYSKGDKIIAIHPIKALFDGSL